MLRARNHINVLEEKYDAADGTGDGQSKACFSACSICRRARRPPIARMKCSTAFIVGRASWAPAGATVRLFPDSWHLGAPSKFTHLALSRQAFEPIRIQRLGRARHYLGPLNGPELLVVLPDAKAIGSVAMSLLGDDDAPGVMFFSSRDPQHYQQGRGTQLLQGDCAHAARPAGALD